MNNELKIKSTLNENHDIRLLILDKVVMHEIYEINSKVLSIYNAIIEVEIFNHDTKYEIGIETITRELTRVRTLVNSNRYTRQIYYNEYLIMERRYLGRHYCTICKNINIGRTAICHKKRKWEKSRDTCNYDKLVNKENKGTPIKMVHYSESFNHEKYERIRNTSIQNYHKLKTQGITREMITRNMTKKRVDDIVQLENSYHITQQVNNKKIYRINEYDTWIGTTKILLHQVESLTKEGWKKIGARCGY